MPRRQDRLGYGITIPVTTARVVPPWGVPSYRRTQTPSLIIPASKRRTILSRRLSADAPRQAGHEDVVVDPIEDLLQIEIDHDPIALGHVLPCLAEGIVRPPAGLRRLERRLGPLRLANHTTGPPPQPMMA